MGGLLVLAGMTRLEIFVHMNLLLRTKDACLTNDQTALEVWRYLCSTNHNGLNIKKGKDLVIRLYADALYRGEEEGSQTGC